MTTSDAPVAPVAPGLPSLVASAVAAAAGVVAAAGLLVPVLGASDPAIVLAVLTAAGLVAVPLVGRALIRADARSRLGWLLVLAGTATIVKLVLDAYARGALADGADLPHAALAEFVSSLATSGQLALAGLAPLLLTGRLPDGRWWRICVAGTFALMALSVVGAFSATFGHFDQVPNPYAAPGGWGQWAGGIGVLVFLGQNVVDVSAALSVSAAIRQLPPDCPPETRRALGLLHRAAWLVAASFLSCLVLGGVGLAGVAYVVEHAALLVFAVCAWVAIRRSGLLDARQVVERAVRYALLTGLVVVVYAALVAGLSRVVDGAVPDLVAVAVAALVALLLRDVAQRGVARLVWGPASDPATALTRLGGRLDAVARPHDVLQVTAHTVRETLRLARVGVLDTHGSVLASSGTEAQGGGVSLPLTFGGERVGTAVLVPAAGDRGLSRRQRALVAGLVPQLAAAVQAVGAGEALAVSQRRLASLRDRERSRIRTDLHDGLGPSLAGIAWGIERARDTVAVDPAAARVELGELAVETRAVVGEVRRLVHDMMPARLEETGLIAALTHDAEALGASVEVTDDCRRLALTSGVEVAAYRIGLEAATNASRHADAATLTVRLGTEGGGRALVVEVEDDGRGIDPTAVAGIGLTSMRQRVAECGGTLDVVPGPRVGTLVRAVLPAPTVRPA